jgi:hypothetical protein
VQLPDLKNHLLSQPCSATSMTNRRAQPILPMEYTGIERAAKGLKIGLENALCLSIPTSSPSRPKLAKATTGQHMDIFHSSHQLVWERKFLLCSAFFPSSCSQSHYGNETQTDMMMYFLSFCLSFFLSDRYIFSFFLSDRYIFFLTVCFRSLRYLCMHSKTTYSLFVFSPSPCSSNPKPNPRLNPNLNSVSPRV